MTDMMIPVVPEVAAALSESTQQLGAYLVQMAQMMQRMQKRLDEMEEAQRKVTLSHEEVKTVQMMIRNRAYEYCEKYQIIAPSALRSISAGIKKSILTRYGVKDLHDVPAIARQAVEAQINHWTDIRLAMKCRDKIRDG